MENPTAWRMTDRFCSTLLPNIYQNVLPEQQNAMQLHPEFFDHPVKNLTVTEETELYLTFIDEGAGFKNVLGYYTYQEGNTPTSEDQLDKIVIFSECFSARIRRRTDTREYNEIAWNL